MAKKNEVFNIEDIALIKGGKRLPKGKKLIEEKTNYPYIRVTDFNDKGTIDLSNIKYISKDIHDTIKRYTISNENVYISIAGTIGKTGIIPKELEGANLTENAAKFIFKKDISIDKRYFYYFTISEWFKQQISIATKVVAMPKLALKRLAKVQILLPPLPEQKRIVKKLDVLFEGIDKSIELVKDNLEEQLPKLKKSLLDQAFKGQLLGATTVGKNGLPVGWKWKKIIEVASVDNAIVNAKKGILYNCIGLENIESDTGKLLDFTPQDGVFIKSSKVEFKKDMVLYSKLRPYLNKVWIADFDGIATTEILPFLCHKSSILPMYLACYLRSPAFLLEVSKNISGARMPRATTKFFKQKVQIPFPSLLEQQKIVKKLDALLENIDELEKENKAKLANLEKLKKSLLDQAFKGKL